MVGDSGKLVIPKLTTRYNVVIFTAHTISTRQSRQAQIAVNCQLFTVRETDRKIGVISYDREQYYINSRS